MIVTNVNISQQTVDEFKKALDRYADFRSTAEGGNKTYSYCLNRAAKDVAARAAQFTHHADSNELRNLLGMPPLTVRTNKKTGQKSVVRPRARYTADASRILWIRMNRAKKISRRAYSPEDWHKKVKEFVGRTLRSVNFMRSGWLHSFRELSRRVKESSGISNNEAFGRRSIDERGEFAVHEYDPKLGEAFPAHIEGEELVVEIANKAVNHRSKTSWSEGLGKHGRQGLEKAMAFKANDMLTWLEDAHDNGALPRAGFK